MHICIVEAPAHHFDFLLWYSTYTCIKLQVLLASQKIIYGIKLWAVTHVLMDVCHLRTNTVKEHIFCKLGLSLYLYTTHTRPLWNREQRNQTHQCTVYGCRTHNRIGTWCTLTSIHIGCMPWERTLAYNGKRECSHIPLGHLERWRAPNSSSEQRNLRIVLSFSPKLFLTEHS